MDFGLMFFASTEETLNQANRYQLITECARYGDQNNFSSIWVPERHFTKFGCLYPNPAVLQAALATITQRIRLRAGSVVVPLHNPIRIAEEWAMVDNLSNGRVGISIAPGWNPNDFVLAPDHYQHRRDFVLEGLETIQTLWTGGKITAQNGIGKLAEVELFPKPIQSKLPIWVTAATNPETFVKAGTLGANILTHTLDQDMEELGQKIALYRETLAKHGTDPQSGKVSVMLHTFVGKELSSTIEEARKPYCDYLKSNAGLLKSLAISRGHELNIQNMSTDELEEFINYLYERFARERGLIGTPESCLSVVQQLKKAGADEIACLLDFGPDVSQVMSHLPYLNQLRQLVQGQNLEEKPIAPKIAVGAFNEDFVDLMAIKSRCSQLISAEEFYDHPVFGSPPADHNYHRVRNVWFNAREALGLIELQEKDIDLVNSNYQFHPALLDACLKMVSGLEKEEERVNMRYEFSGFKGLKSKTLKTNGILWSYAELITKNEEELKARIQIMNEEGEVLLRIEALDVKKVKTQAVVKNNVYELYWKVTTEVADQKPSLVKTDLWVVFNDDRGVGDALIQYLKNADIAYLEIQPGEAWQQTGSQIKLNPGSKSDFQQLMEVCHLVSAPRGKLVYLWGLKNPRTVDPKLPQLSQYWDESLSGGLHLLQSFCKNDSPTHWKTWLITQGAQRSEEDQYNPGFMQAPLWGLARSAALELSDHWGGIIDLEPDLDNGFLADQLMRVISLGNTGQQMTIRKGKIYELQLRSAARNPRQIKSHLLSSDATYLITGGRGGLGLKCAEWLVGQGVRHLVLVGRSQPDASARQLIDRLQDADCHVELAYTDITDEGQLQELITMITDKLPPLKGIFHLAVVLEDQSIELQDKISFRRVTKPKLEGTWNLHQLTRHLDLDLFVNFSTISSVMPGHGQAAYASANNFLDSIAHYRQGLGLNSVSINWGPWDNVGTIATEHGKMIQRTLAREGVNTLPVREGFEILNGLIEGEAAQVMAINLNLAMIGKGEGVVESYLNRFGYRSDTPSTRPQAYRNELLDQWKNLSDTECYREVEDYIKSTIAEVLKVDTTVLEPQYVLQSLGMDSLMAIEMRNRIQKALNVQLSIVQFMQASTVQNITDALYQQVLNTSANGTYHQPTEPILNGNGSDQNLGLQEQLLDIDSLMEEDLDGLIGKLSS